MNMNTERIKILYVEDDEVDQMAFKRMVKAKKLPYDYIIADAVSKAVELLRTERFDIVALDLRLRDGTAFDIIPSIADTPFIIATGSGDEEFAVKAMKTGASEYLIKDVDRRYLELLPTTIHEAVRHYKTEKDAMEKDMYLKAVVENIYSGIIGVDENGVISMINPIAMRVFGYSEEEIVHSHISRLIPFSFAVEDDKKIVKKLESGNIRIIDSGYEGTGTRKDGSEFPIIFNISEIWTSSRKFLNIAFMDISDRKQVESFLQEQALHDGLTGLYNKRAIQSIFKDELERSIRYGRSFALLMLDIDHFKNLNDTYGHQAGDEVLKGLALIIKKSIRKVDKAARYGGEEFVIILPEAEKEDAFKVAEKLRSNVESHQFAAGQNSGQEAQIKSTISIGVAGFPEDGAAMDSLISAADKALYAAKRSGRNRVVRSVPALSGRGGE